MNVIRRRAAKLLGRKNDSGATYRQVIVDSVNAGPSSANVTLYVGGPIIPNIRFSDHLQSTISPGETLFAVVQGDDMWISHRLA